MIRSRGIGAIGRLPAAVLAAFLLFGRSAPARGWDEAPSPVVAKVIVLVDGRDADAPTREMISVREGDLFSLRKVDAALKQIHQTGLFSNVLVSRSGGGDAVELTFALSRRLMTRSVVVSADQSIPQDKILDGLESIRKGTYFSENRIPKAVEEAKSILKQEGFFHAEILASPEKDEAASAVDVRFRVSSWRKYDLERIEFRGNLLVPESDLRKKMRLGEDANYVPSRFAAGLARIRSFYNELGYRRAEVELDQETFNESGRSVAVVVRVNPRERINIIVHGFDVPKSLLAPIWEERIFEEWGLAEGETQIMNDLRKKGHVFATLKSSIERDENEIRVIYHVQPGDICRIEGIAFKGIRAFTADRLKKETGIGDKIPLFAVVDGQRLFEIPREIEFFYETQGFADARVDLNLDRRGSAVKATFFIEEGPQRKIGSMALNGVRMFQAGEIEPQLLCRPGEPYFPANIQIDIEKIAAFYLNHGVRGTRISHQVEPAGDNLFSLAITVEEGQKVRVGSIIIAGNRVTRKSVILRELRIRQGEDADRERILETKRRLERLGIFSEVKIDEISVSPGVINLVIGLMEGERNYIGLGLGMETKAAPRNLAVWDNPIGPRGTVEYIRSNLLGMASQLSLISQFSLIEKRAVVSWDQPYFFKFPLQTNLLAWIEEEDRQSFGFDRRGVSLTTMRSLYQNLVLLTTFSYSRTKLTFLKIAESQVDRPLFPYSTTQLSGSLILDRRDDSFNPERGYFASVVGNWAYPLFNAESDFLKLFFKFQYFYPLVRQVNLSATMRVGLGRGRIPIPERFFAGGSNSFRGEEYDMLGPKDPVYGEPVGGVALFLMNLEMSFPLLESVKNLAGAVFYDLGNVFSKRKDFSLLGLRGALGFGVRYKTPLGPVRFDLGWNLDAPEPKRGPLAFITIGTVF
ncbi:MAG TPA: POTRA domain-containing protein [Candidatus Aminicenantes bacterium]|nr:POTRA domain-containing protein [Candidatus Aminicenantes bacterium]